MRTTVPTPGCSRAATTASPETALMTSGYSSRIVDVNPANSGGTAADEAVGGDSGSGSRARC